MDSSIELPTHPINKNVSFNPNYVMKNKQYLTMMLFMMFSIYHSQSQTPKKYAILITGCKPSVGISDNPNPNIIGSDFSNHPFDEFWNDTYLMWELLVTQKGFSDENVYVLFHNGIDKNLLLNMDWIDVRYTVAHSGLPLTHITDYAARKEDLTNVLIGLFDGSNGINKVSEDDFLFVFTFGHGMIYNMGTSTQMGTLRLQDYDMMDYEFAELFNRIPTNKRVIWMQNCVGGDFATQISNSIESMVSTN